MLSSYPPEAVPTKKCSGCQRMLPLTAFSRHRGAKDGLQTSCRECQKVWYQQYKIHGSYRPHRPIRAAPDGHKWCTGCDELKPVAEFYKNRGRKGGLTDTCKTCQLTWSRERYARDPKYRRRYLLAKKYGMTLDAYDALLEAQGGVCAICGEAGADAKMLAVDHDHNTGKVRGLLCDKCNQGIGLFRDDPELMAKAIQYIKEAA